MTKLARDKDGRLKQPSSYPDGRTKQSFKDEADINKILSRAQRAGTLSHLQKYEGVYADFSDFDYLDAQLKLTRGREIFDDLPAELRNEFAQSPAAFFAYVNDPANVEKLNEKLPALALPGRQQKDVSGRTPPDDPPQGVSVAAGDAKQSPEPSAPEART